MLGAGTYVSSAPWWPRWGIAANANGNERRLTRLNGADAAAADIAELLPVLWLTPAMDRLFLEGASGRRRFLDRLVFGLDVGHAKRTVAYETAMRERARLLAMGRTDPAWLDGLEETMAENGAAITRARLDAIAALNGALVCCMDPMVRQISLRKPRLMSSLPATGRCTTTLTALACA